MLDRRLLLDEAVVERIRQRFARHNIAMPAINTRQAMVPDGAAVLENENGTAPELWMEHEGTRILLLPGPLGSALAAIARQPAEKVAG